MLGVTALKLFSSGPVNCSSGLRMRFTRPLPFSNRFGLSAIGKPGFCTARTRLPTAGVFRDRGSRNMSLQWSGWLFWREVEWRVWSGNWNFAA
jgi:hypothetical protein